MISVSARLRAPSTVLSLLPVVVILACSGGSDEDGPLGPGGEVASITVTLETPTAVVGARVLATAIARDASGKTVESSFSWSSSDTDVATIAANGDITGVTAGSTTITAVASGVSGTATLAVDPKSLNAMIEAIRASAGLPAMAGAIVTSKGLVGIGVAGTRQTGGAGGTVTLNDKWHIGSNLKAITGALAAIAVTEGKISWNTTVEDMFPEHSATMHNQYRAVKLEDLLANRAGIRNDPPGTAYNGATPRQQRENVAKWALEAAPIGPVGGFFYSNPSFIIAGAMVERALGGDYETLLATKLGQPLGVTSLGFGVVPSGNPVAHYRSGSSWIPCSASNCDNPPGLSAAGRAHMSIGDWSRIVGEMIRADAGKSTLISSQNGRKLFTGLTELPPSSDMYSLGWFMTTRPWAGGRTATHTGSNNLNHSVAWLGMGPEVGFLAVTNAADLSVSGTITTQALDNLILAMIDSYF